MGSMPASRATAVRLAPGIFAQPTKVLGESLTERSRVAVGVELEARAGHGQVNAGGTYAQRTR